MPCQATRPPWELSQSHLPQSRAMCSALRQASGSSMPLLLHLQEGGGQPQEGPQGPEGEREEEEESNHATIDDHCCTVINAASLVPTSGQRADQSTSCSAWTFIINVAVKVIVIQYQVVIRVIYAIFHMLFPVALLISCLHFRRATL